MLKSKIYKVHLNSYTHIEFCNISGRHFRFSFPSYYEMMVLTYPNKFNSFNIQKANPKVPAPLRTIVKLIYGVELPKPITKTIKKDLINPLKREGYKSKKGIFYNRGRK